jgi:hypothetical protein
MEDLPSDLYGSDNCRKTLVKENDILKANRAVRTPYVQNVYREGAYCSATSSVRGALNSNTTIGLFKN